MTEASSPGEGFDADDSLTVVLTVAKTLRRNARQFSLFGIAVERSDDVLVTVGRSLVGDENEAVSLDTGSSPAEGSFQPLTWSP